MIPSLLAVYRLSNGNGLIDKGKQNRNLKLMSIKSFFLSLYNLSKHKLSLLNVYDNKNFLNVLAVNIFEVTTNYN